MGKVECYTEDIYDRQNKIQKILSFITDERARRNAYQDGRNQVVEEKAKTLANRLDVKIRTVQLMGQYFYMAMNKKDIPSWL